MTQLVEEAADAMHREMMGQAELQARNLQEALVHHEQAELRRTREMMGQENAEMKWKMLMEAEREIHRQQVNAQTTVEEYKRVIDRYPVRTKRPSCCVMRHC